MSRRTAWGLVAAVLAVGLAAGIGADRLFRSVPSTAREPSVRAELGPSFSVSPEIVGLGVLGERLWIQTQGGAAWGNEGQAHTYRLDPAGMGGVPRLEGPLDEAIFGIPIEASGQAFGGANTFALAGKRVWAGYVVAAGRVDRARVRELDRRTGRAIGRALTVPGVPERMAVADGYVWLVTHDENELGMRLWQIDPARHTLVGSSLRIAAAEEESSAPLATSKRRLWLASGGKLFEIDLVRQPANAS